MLQKSRKLSEDSLEIIFCQFNHISKSKSFNYKQKQIL